MKPVSEMTPDERALTLRWIAGWKQASVVLEEVREQEIRSAETVASMEILDGAFTHAVLSMPARESSGLIEQQKIFSRARR